MSASADNPFAAREGRAHTDGPFDSAEMALANRNSGMPLEALRADVTPVGMHYLLTHFDTPLLDQASWRLQVRGAVARGISLGLDEIRAMPSRTLRVTLECAGNGRALYAPRYQSMPWQHGAVSTADWTGVPLRVVLEAAGLADDAREIAFTGADRGFDNGHEHEFARSLGRDHALADEVLLAYAMNGAPLGPQHGFPLRLVVPGWYGMASVKWLTRIDALAQPFEGYQQLRAYHYRASKDGPRTPVRAIRVKSLMVPPGVPDWYSRQRLVAAGPVEMFGRAWSGEAVAIAKVEFAVDGEWQAAMLEPASGPYAWSGWRARFEARPGAHVLMCRATDAEGATQPLDAAWDWAGFGNNSVQQVAITVR